MADDLFGDAEFDDDDVVVPNHNATKEKPSIKKWFGAGPEDDDDEDFEAPSAKSRGRSTGSTATKRKAKPVKPMPKGGLEKPLTDLYTAIGVFVTPFDQICGPAIVASGPDCAKALNDLAAHNPAVRNALISLVTTSDWGKVIIAHVGIFGAIAMHHVPAVQKMAGREFAEDVEQSMKQEDEAA